MTNQGIRRFVLRSALATATLCSAGLVSGITPITPSASAAPAVGLALGDIDDPAVVQATEALIALKDGNQAAYLSSITALATSIGPRVEIDPQRLIDAWSTATPGVTAMLSALTQLGVSYHYATSTPGVSFDCSGLVRWAWSQAGVNLPSNSSSIIRSMDNTGVDQIEPGDVLWYPGHVMIALGVDDAYVHAVGRGKKLEVHSMWAKKRNRLRVIDPAG